MARRTEHVHMVSWQGHYCVVQSHPSPVIRSLHAIPLITPPSPLPPQPFFPNMIAFMTSGPSVYSK